MSEPVRSPIIAKTGGKNVKISYFRSFNDKILVSCVSNMIKYHSKWTVHNRYKVYWISWFVRWLSNWKVPPKPGVKIPKLAFYAFRLAYWLINLKYSFFMLIKQCRNMHRRFLHTFSYVRNLSEAQFVPKPGVKMSKYHIFEVLMTKY